METRYYSSFDTDFVKSRNQGKKLPENYKWIHRNPFYIAVSYLMYYLVLVIAFVYVKLIKHDKFGCLGSPRTARVVYANHTLEGCDVLAPFLYCFPKRPYIICSSANLGIPVIGPLLPLAGALVVPSSLKQTAEFSRAVKTRLYQRKTIVVYPEGHLWPFCTFIRPLASSAFYYPAVVSCPVFTATTIFKKSRGKKPKLSIEFDGPFESSLESRKAREKAYFDFVENSLKSHATHSTFTAISYKQKS